jgi:hypothetical protein
MLAARPSGTGRLWQETGENPSQGNVSCESWGKTDPETQDIRRGNSLICSFLAFVQVFNMPASY